MTTKTTMTKKTDTQAAAPEKPSPLSELSDFAGTPGAEYVDGFLRPALPTEDRFDLEAIAGAVNEGSLTVCPVCHFLRIPGGAVFQSGHFPGGAVPGGLPDCDVCALLPRFREDPFDHCVIDKSWIADADAVAAEARLHRARCLHDLWMGAYNGAQAVAWEVMARALRTCAATEGEGGPDADA